MPIWKTLISQGHWYLPSHLSKERLDEGVGVGVGVGCMNSLPAVVYACGSNVNILLTMSAIEEKVGMSMLILV